VKKGRHRRFEEARALKQAFDFNGSAGSTLLTTPLEEDEFVLRRLPGADFNDLTLTLWLSDPADKALRGKIDDAVDDWYHEATSGPTVVHDLQDGEEGTSDDGRAFITWWTDLGSAPPAVLNSLADRFRELREAGHALLSLEAGPIEL